MLDFNKTASDYALEYSTAEVCARLNDRIEALAFSLLGPPNEALSTSKELRYGRQGSLSINLETAKWFHHEERTGGAGIELLAWHANVDEDEALELARQWLGVNVVKFEPKPKQQTAAAPQKAPPKFVAAYNYVDESRTLLFQVVRYRDPKTFRQRRPDGHGGWIWKTDGVRKVPYRLPELLRAVAAGQRIHIVEGEKDADTLAALGLAATCNPEGAGKWRREFAGFFHGADVAILPDNDDPGRKHAIDVANSLDGVVAAWRVVQLPGLPEKGDPFDWLAAGGTAEALDALVEAAPVGQMPDTETPPADDAPPDADPATPQGLTPTPYTRVDPKTIPTRKWLYGRHLIRQFVSVTVAPGGVGKSALAIAEALAMVSGKPLLGEWVPYPLRVWVLNMEDPMDELTRRIEAAIQHFGLTDEDIGDRLLVDSGRSQSLCTAITLPSGTQLLKPVIDNLIHQITANRVDVFAADPFISTHRLNENDNAAMDLVVKQQWGKVADETNCAVELVHHTRKQNGFEITSESARGASALVGAARDVRVINAMTPKQAEAAGVENHRLHFSLHSDKGNLAPPAEKAKWFRKESVDLGNGDEHLPHGDSVVVVTPWEWPDAFAGITQEMVRECQLALDGGTYWKSSQAQTDWAGELFAPILGIDVSEKEGRAHVQKIINEWIKNEALQEIIATDERRKPRRAVVAGIPAVEEVSD